MNLTLTSKHLKSLLSRFAEIYVCFMSQLDLSNIAIKSVINEGKIGNACDRRGKD